MRNSKPYLSALKIMQSKAPDKAKAFKYLQRAFELKDASAAYALATWYLHGIYVKKDLKRGVKFLRQAISTEYIPEAFYDLAISYEKGLGIKKDEKKAYDLYLNAAIWGHKKSYFEVGRCLFYGLGVSKNKSLARSWLKRAEILGYERKI